LAPVIWLSGNFEQPRRAYAAANAHGYDDVTLRRLLSIKACPTTLEPLIP